MTSQLVSNGLELSHLIKRRSSFWYYVIYIFFRRMTKKKYDFTCEELHKRAKTASSRRSKVLSCTAWLWRDIWGIFSDHYWYMKSIMAKDISKKCLSQNNWRVPKQLISRYKSEFRINSRTGNKQRKDPCSDKKKGLFCFKSYGIVIILCCVQ